MAFSVTICAKGNYIIRPSKSLQDVNGVTTKCPPILS